MKQFFLALLIVGGFCIMARAENNDSNRSLTEQQIKSIEGGVASAFRIPPGAIVTPDMMPALTKIREKYEPRLRALLTAVQFASEKEKDGLVREIQAVRAQIMSEANPIFAAKIAEIQRKQAEARRKALEAYRKKMQEQQRRRNQSKNRHKKHRR